MVTKTCQPEAAGSKYLIIGALAVLACNRAPEDGVFQPPRTIVTCDPELDEPCYATA